jgi:hypothetical protein
MMYSPARHREACDAHMLTRQTMMVFLEDIEPPTASTAAHSYSFDYSLMVIVFSILIFLWIQ